MRVHSRHKRLCWALVLVLSWWCSSSSGQGNRPTSATVLGSSSTVARLQQLYSNSKQWRQAYLRSPASSCSRAAGRANLCASSSDDVTESLNSYAQLLLATSPRVYSSNDTQQPGNLQLVAPAGNQHPCQTCTAFAVAAAAATAMASMLRVNATDCSISVQALYFCPQEEAGPVKSCSGGWNLPDALAQLELRGRTLPTAECLPYRPDVRSLLPRAQLCQGKCNAPSVYAGQGSFSSVQVVSPWEAQEHIRLSGAVVSRFDVFSDFRPFFANKANAKKVYRPAANATLLYGHAVALVGYNNEEEWWLALNSWGPDFADGGLFRVAFDTCSVLVAGWGEAYGVIWTPSSPSEALQLPVTPAPKAPGCYVYKARPGDYLSRVARLAGIPLEQFMLDNTAVVKDLDAPITGLQLLLCKPNPDNIFDGTKPVDKQLQSLLKIKAAIDTAGVLKEWSKERGANGGYCNWLGVTCNSGSSDITELKLAFTSWGIQGLQGRLPPAAAFDGLPGLQRLTIADQPGILGPLPSDWLRLQQLQDIRVANNSLTGTLPPSWAELKQLKVLYLWGNELTGSLPPAWSGMQALQQLSMNGCKLSGALPPLWGRLGRLTSLGLAGNQLVSSVPEEFSRLTALEQLDLARNSLSGRVPPSLGRNLKRLKMLVLTGNQLTGPVPQLEALQLQVLGLSSNVFTGTLPSSLARLQQLEVLGLQTNKLRGKLPQEYTNMTALQQLGLRGNMLTGSLPESWGQLKSLTRLYVDKNQLSGPLPASFSALSALRELSVGSNKFAGELPRSWGQLRELRLLDVQDCALSGTLPDAFSALSRLETLALASNKFKGSVPRSWVQLRQLTTLAMDNNPGLQGCLPAIWRQNLAVSGYDVQGSVFEGTGLTGFCSS